MFAHSHFYLEILGYYTCSTIVSALFVEHFQGQQAELIGYALGFWPSPTELGRNWHSATHKKPYLPWTGPDKGIESSNMHCIPRRKACFLELVRHCVWWAAWHWLSGEIVHQLAWHFRFRLCQDCLSFSFKLYERAQNGLWLFVSAPCLKNHILLFGNRE